MELQKKSWWLFIDDERFPIDQYIDTFIMARSYDDAVVLVEAKGCPLFISFDHDLGDNIPTGYDFAKFLVEKDLDLDGSFIPDKFNFHVHSANPVGKANIEKLLRNYLEHRNKNKINNETALEDKADKLKK